MSNRLKQTIFENSLMKKGATILTIGGLAASLSGCLSSVDKAKADTPPASPSTSQEVTPSATPTPTETFVDKHKIIEAYESLPIEDFNQLPQKERLKVVADKMLSFNMNGGPTELFTAPTAGGKRVLDYDPLMESGEGNDGQSIMEQDAYMTQLVMAQLVDMTRPTGELDAHSAQMMISGLTYYVGDKANTVRHTAMLNIIDKNPVVNGYMEYTSPVVSATTDLLTGVDKEGNSIKYKDLTYTQNGNTYEERRVWTPLPPDDRYTQTGGSQNPGLWLLYTKEKIS